MESLSLSCRTLSFLTHDAGLTRRSGGISNEADSLWANFASILIKVAPEANSLCQLWEKHTMYWSERLSGNVGLTGLCLHCKPEDQ